MCTGSETHLFDCRHSGWGRHDCGHSEDVSISCTNGNVLNDIEHHNLYKKTLQPYLTVGLAKVNDAYTIQLGKD